MNLRFEYGVILNGSQTVGEEPKAQPMFEYGVILNGSQTKAEAVKKARIV